MTRWILFALVAAGTAWLVQPPLPPAHVVAGLVFFCALSLGLALDETARKRRVIVVHEADDE